MDAMQIVACLHALDNQRAEYLRRHLFEACSFTPQPLIKGFSIVGVKAIKKGTRVEGGGLPEKRDLFGAAGGMAGGLLQMSFKQMGIDLNFHICRAGILA